MALETIITQGAGGMKGGNRVTCADGFTMSVIAGPGAYCSPRPDFPGIKGSGRVSAEFSGPYVAVEVGYPSERPEPWSDWEQYCESPDGPTETVYGYVPVDLVRALVVLHGGEK